MGFEAILRSERVLLVEQSHHNDGDGDEIIGGQDHVDDDGDDGGYGDGVYDTSAYNDLFCVGYLVKLKIKIKERVPTPSH